MSSELPGPGPQRWMAGKKAMVLTAIQKGALSLEEACRRYVLTPEELQTWHRAFATDGVAGLRVSRMAERRATARRKVSEPAAAILDGGDRLECTITDIGCHGARLDFRVRLPVPRQFRLVCHGTGRRVPVSVKWQRQALTGVQFVVPASHEPADTEDLGSWLLGRA